VALLACPAVGLGLTNDKVGQANHATPEQLNYTGSKP